MVGSQTSTIWMAESSTNADRGVSPGAWAASCGFSVAIRQVAQERHQDVRLDPMLQLVMDRADGPPDGGQSLCRHVSGR